MAPPKKLVTTEDGAEEAKSTILTGAGDDTTAASGDDTLAGGAGADTIAGGQGDAADFNGADPAKFDHDGDGKPGGSLPKAAEVTFTLEQVKVFVTEAVAAALSQAQPPATAEPEDGEEEDEADISALEPGAVVTRGAPPPRPTVGPGSDMVLVRITKTGQGQVHTGATGTGSKRTYDWRDEVALPREIGEALEGRSYGEILE